MIHASITTLNALYTSNSGDTASCLHNAPHEDEALGRQLPGTLLTLDAQCRRDRGTSACFKDERVCAQLFCFDAASGYCVAYRPAAEGSSCGDGQVSLRHRFMRCERCIVPHTHIGHYRHQTLELLVELRHRALHITIFTARWQKIAIYLKLIHSTVWMENAYKRMKI